MTFKHDDDIIHTVLDCFRFYGGLMMNRKPYSSAIKKTPFKYPIAKKIAKLMLDGLDREEVYKE